MRAKMRHCTWPKRTLEEVRTEVVCFLGNDRGKAIQEEKQVQHTGIGA